MSSVQVKREMFAEPIMNSRLSDGMWLMETPLSHDKSRTLVCIYFSELEHILASGSK